MSSARWSLLFSCALLGASPARSAEPLALSNLVEQALSAHPSIRAAGHAARARAEQAGGAGSWENPRLEFEVEDLPADDARWGAAKRTMALAQALPAPGKTSGRRAAAEAARMRSEVALAQARSALARSVWDDWAAALAGIRRTQAAEESLAAARELQRLVERAREAGAFGEAEVLAARAEAESAALEVEQSARRRDDALRSLEALIGAPVAVDRLDPAQLDRLTEVPPPAESLLVRGARADLAERAAAEHLAGLEGRPDVELRAGVGFDAYTDDPMLVFSVGVPIPLSARRRAEVAAAREERLAAEASLAAAQRAADLRARSLAAELRGARARVEASRDRLVPLARRSYDAARRSFEAGRAGWTTVLGARRELARAEAELIEQLQTWHAAAAESAQGAAAPMGEQGS